MEQKELYDLITRFENSSLTVMEIEQDSFKVHLEKGGIQVQPAQVLQPQARETAPAPTEQNTYEKVKAPIVGVYYASPSPEDAPYVSVGEKVSKGQVLCLVEAMKMMNELKSPVDGIVQAIHGINGELVEFDQVLFEVEPC